MPIKKLTINNIGQNGLNTDIASWDLPPDFITYGKNFKVKSNSLVSSSGSILWTTPPSNYNAGYIMHIKNSTSDYFICAGRSKVMYFDGANWGDISSIAGYAGIGTDDELLWTGTLLGNIPILNNPQAQPEYWSPASPGQALQPLQFDATNTWTDKGYSAKVIRSHQNYLFALNLQETTTELPNAYRWSHPADINGLPFTWDETDVSALAGKAQIGGDAGALIDGKTLRNSFVLYSENAINILDPTGDEFVWKRRELSSTIGLLSQNALVEVKGKHYFISDGDIFVTDGTSIESIIHNRIKNAFNSNINPDYFNRSYAVKQTSRKEIWFCIPTGDAIYPNTAYIYNWGDNSWSVKDLPYETTTDATGVVTVTHGITFADYGPTISPSENWDSVTGTWEEGLKKWGSKQNEPLDDTLIGIDFSDSSLHNLDPRTATSTPLNTVLERTNFPLGNYSEVFTTSKVYLQISGSGPVEVQFGAQHIAGGPIKWKSPSTYTPGITRKVDVRVTGKFLCWRVKSIDSANFSFSGMSIEYVPNGYR